MSAYFKTFAEIPTYSDQGSRNQLCRDLLPKGIVPELAVGYDIIEGPGRNGPTSHSSWDQVFVVLQGQGVLVRDDERISLRAPCIALIPANTAHDVEVAPGDRIEYVYINKYLAEDQGDH